MSGVVDPNLELQQLASQALQYQHEELQRLEYGSVPKYSPDAEYPTDGKFPCPFPTCNRDYKRKDLLKRHLTTLLASPDEHHQDQNVWEHVREDGVMTIYTRPRNLTEDQKKQRRKDSNLRHRVKYAQELKEKRNRKRRVEKLLEGKQVGVQTPDWEAEAKQYDAGTGFHSSTVLTEQPGYTIEKQPRGGRRAGIPRN
jgi:hypothetical protein